MHNPELQNKQQYVLLEKTVFAGHTLMPSRRSRSRSHSRSRSPTRNHRDRRSASPERRRRRDLPKGTNPIAESDYFQKSDEFRLWLKEEKRKVCVRFFFFAFFFFLVGIQRRLKRMFFSFFLECSTLMNYPVTKLEGIVNHVFSPPLKVDVSNRLRYSYFRKFVKVLYKPPSCFFDPLVILRSETFDKGLE